MTATIIRTTILALFIIFMIAIGIITRKKIKNEKDFILGGGGMGSWMSAFAYGTTYFSAVVFIGYGGSVSWQYGLSSIWIGIGNAIIGSLLAWIVLAKRTHQQMHAMDASTMPEYFEKRFGSKMLRTISAVIIFLFLIPYSASVYSGLGLLFQQVFGISPAILIISMGVLTAIYLTLGGYLATAINDFVQGIIMLAGITIVVTLVVTNPDIGGIAGGMTELARQSAAEGNIVALNSPFSFSFNLICLIIMTSLGTWGLPQMAHKFHAIKSVNGIKQAAIISTFFALVIGGGSYFMGTFGRVYMEGVKPAGGSEAVVPTMLQQVLGSMGTWGNILFGVIAVVVLSASMSTLASLVLTSSSSATLDLLKNGVAPKLEGKKLLLVMRSLCVVFLAISVAFALKKVDAIVNLMSYSWGAVAGAFIGPYLFGLYWKGMNKYGVYAGFIYGVGITLLGIILGKSFAPAPNIGAFAIVGSLIISPLVSMLANKLQGKPILGEKQAA